jgi:DNA/RNA-binding domain of Phe-tRNA-synthetase-like protein
MGYKELTFEVAEQVKAIGVRGVYLAMGELTNRDTDPEFELLKKAALQKAKVELSVEGIDGDPILKGFRDLHSAIGFSNRQFVSAPENLLANLVKNDRFPHVNLLVDIYNVVSVETRLALGAHDIGRVSGNINLRMTRGDEGFWPIGSSMPNRTRPGGYAYIDDANDVLCMLEVRQVEKTKADLSTTDCFYIIQGNSATSLEYIGSAAQRLIALTHKFCGGTDRVLAAF